MRYIALYTMENIVIPKLSEIQRASKSGIDRPATLCETMRYRVLSRDSEGTFRIFTDVFAKLDRHRMTGSHGTPLANVYELVKDFSATVMRERQIKPSALHPILRFMGNRSISTIETFDSDTERRLKKETKLLEKTVQMHQKLIAAVQKAQRIYWKSQDEAGNYKIKLSTAQASRDELGEKLSARELRTRDRAITNLQRTLKEKESRENKAYMTYFQLCSEVEVTRREMRKLSQNLHLKLTLSMLDRAEASVSILKNLAETLLSGESRSDFLQRLDGVDVLDTVHAIVNNNLKVYTSPDIRKYMTLHGVNDKIPSGSESNGHYPARSRSACT